MSSPIYGVRAGLAAEQPAGQDLPLLIDTIRRIQARLGVRSGSNPSANRLDATSGHQAGVERSNHRLRLLLCLVIRAIGRIPGSDQFADWDALCPPGDEAPYLFALAAQARWGSEESASSLLRKAPKSLLATAIILDGLPALAQTYFKELIRSHRVHELLREEEVGFISGNIEDVCVEYHLSWSPEIFASLEDELVLKRTSVSSLMASFLHAPGLRTLPVASELMSRLTVSADAGTRLWDLGFTDPSGSDDDHSRTLASLEVLFPERTRAALRKWALSTDPLDRDFASNTLLRIGDPLAGPLLVNWIKERCGWFPLDMGILLLLTQSDCREVTVFIESLPTPWEMKGDAGLHRSLADLVRDGDGMRALAAIRGIPIDVAACLRVPVSAELEENEKDYNRSVSGWKRLIAGDAKGALLDILGYEAGAPALGLSEEPPPLGLVDHPEVRAYLQLVRERRDLGLYWWATGQLAMLDHPGAVAELKATSLQPPQLNSMVVDPRPLLRCFYPEGVDAAVASLLKDPDDFNTRAIVSNVSTVLATATRQDLLSHPPMRSRIFRPEAERLAWSRLIRKYIVIPTK